MEWVEKACMTFDHRCRVMETCEKQETEDSGEVWRSKSASAIEFVIMIRSDCFRSH